MDDLFGFVDPDEPRSLTPPDGYEAVHQEGMSWAKQGSQYQNTSRVSPAQWNHLIAQMRGLVGVDGINVNDVASTSPLLLRTFIIRAIIALLDGTVIDADGLAPLVSPAFTGTPTAPTPSAGNNSTRVATTAFVKTALDALIAAAPGALDTLDELAAALGDDPAFSTTVLTALSNRVRLDAAQSLTAAQQAQARNNISAPLKGWIYGLTLGNNAGDAANDIDIGGGVAASTEANAVLMTLNSAITKRLDAAWAAGNNQGGRDTGSIADGTWHVWLIQRSDTAAVDVLYSLSASAPTMPSPYDRKRRIGSILREGGSIVAFSQVGDTFRRAIVTDRNNTAAASAALLALSVPAGIVVAPLLEVLISCAASASASVRLGNAAAGTTEAIVATVLTGAGDSNDRSCATPGPVFFTNTSRQIYFSQSITTGALADATLSTFGWVDRRGQDGGL